MNIPIFCPKCADRTRAVKLLAKVGRSWRWVNRCTDCGEAYEAPAPPDPAKELGRRERKHKRELEAAGQQRLFPW